MRSRDESIDGTSQESGQICNPGSVPGYSFGERKLGARPAVRAQRRLRPEARKLHGGLAIRMDAEGWLGYGSALDKVVGSYRFGPRVPPRERSFRRRNHR